MAEPHNGFWDFLGDADDLLCRVEVVRALVHDAARGDPGATAMLLSMLRAVENVLRDVESALARRN